MNLGNKFISMNPIKAYGIVVIGFLPALVVILVCSVLDNSSLTVIIASTAMIGTLAFSYLARAYIVRNYEPIKERLSQSKSSEEAVSIIFGGWKWGVPTVAIATLFCLLLVKFI